MKNLTILSAAVAMAFSVSANAAVVDFGNSNALQGVLDNITVNGLSSVDVDVDGLADDSDSQWTIGGTGGSVSTMVIELAGFAGTNTFGVYDLKDPSNSIELFGGAASTGAQVLLSIDLGGSIFINSAYTGTDFGSLGDFGYYLDVAATSNRYYSDTLLNTDGFDHMAAYEGEGDVVQVGNWAPGPWGSNEYVLAWEDLHNGGDKDFTDFVVMVESVSPVPEPTALALLGLGLAGFGFTRRAKK